MPDRQVDHYKAALDMMVSPMFKNSNDAVLIAHAILSLRQPDPELLAAAQLAEDYDDEEAFRRERQGEWHDEAYQRGVESRSGVESFGRP